MAIESGLRRFSRFVPEIFLVLLLVAGPIYSVVYTNVHVDPGTYANQGLTDPLEYLRMYDGQAASPPFRYRVLTVYLARLLPAPPAWIFSDQRRLSKSWIARIQFGVVNFIFLALTAIVLFYYLRDFEFTKTESLLGTALFLTCRPLVQTAGLPLVDASAWFFLLFGFFCIRRVRAGWLALDLLVGAFAKETVFLLATIVALDSTGKCAKLRMSLALVPATLAYLTYRIYTAPAGQSILAGTFHFALASSLLHFNAFLDLGSSFSSLWIFAAYALVTDKIPGRLRSWSWFIPLMLVVIIFTGSNLGRILFLAFPVVIPLTLFGIRSSFSVHRAAAPAA